MTRTLILALGLGLSPLAALALPAVGDVVGTNPTDATAALKALGHTLKEVKKQGCAQVILVRDGHPEGAADTRPWPDSAVAVE